MYRNIPSSYIPMLELLRSSLKVLFNEGSWLPELALAIALAQVRLVVELEKITSSLSTTHGKSVLACLAELKKGTLQRRLASSD